MSGATAGVIADLVQSFALFAVAVGLIIHVTRDKH